jgi:DNA-binding NtrC family response regulator
MDLATRVGLGASILVVDDNELNRDALSCLLRLHQYNVDSAARGQEALGSTSSPRSDSDEVRPIYRSSC